MEKVKALDYIFTETIMTWYRQNQRVLPWRSDREPYHVWVSEIMLQQTRVEAVKSYYQRFMETLPDIKDLAEADEQTLLKLWQGLGYYNRVRNMRKAAETVREDYGGYFPRSYEDIKGLSGIGDYTAGAIASICFDEPTPAVDGNVLRVMSRLTEDYSDIKAAATKKRFTALLEKLYPKENCGDFTQGLIELGALICIPNGRPQCELCPVAGFCSARQNNTVMELPVKTAKKPRKTEEKTVFILTCQGKVAVSQRPAGSLLANLYQFPNVGQPLTAASAVSQAEVWGCRPKDLVRRIEYTHVFTHVEWKMVGYHIECEDTNDAFTWVTEDTLEKEIPLPTAFRYFWDRIAEN